MFINCSILDFETMVEVVKYLKTSSTDDVEYDEDQMTKAINVFDLLIGSRNPLPFIKNHGSKYALIIFSFSKISFTIISFVQLYFLNYFIGNGSQLFGVEVLIKMWHGEFFSEWTIFPRNTICNFSFSAVEIDHTFSVC